MNQPGGHQSLTHELNLIPMVLELVEIIANSSDQQQDVTRKVFYSYTSTGFNSSEVFEIIFLLEFMYFQLELISQSFHPLSRSHPQFPAVKAYIYKVTANLSNPFVLLVIVFEGLLFLASKCIL